MKKAALPQGMALVLCLLIMSVAALIGIGIATSSNIDSQISRNQRDFTKDFFIADGINRAKQAKILTDNNLAPTRLDRPKVVLNDKDANNSKIPHTLPGSQQELPTTPRYTAKIEYLFRRHVSSGYSIENSNHFKYYHYAIKTHPWKNNREGIGIKTIEKKLGI